MILKSANVSPCRSIVMIGLAGVMLAGCAAGDGGVSRALVAPGNYDLYDCNQMAGVGRGLATRNRQLEKLIVRARQGPGGGFVAATAYEPEYNTNTVKLRDLQRVMAERKCAAPAGGGRQSETIIR